MKDALAKTIAMFGVLTLVGCTQVTTEGELAGRRLNLSGTAFAWLDQTAYEIGEDGAIHIADRENKDVTMYIRLYEAQFDPTTDFSFLPAETYGQIMTDISNGDSVQVAIRRGHELEEGTDLKYDNVDLIPVPEDEPYLTLVTLSMGREPVTQESTYPDEYNPLGSHLEGKLSVENFSLPPEGQLQGKLEIEINAIEGWDADDAQEGTVIIRFVAPIIAERIAECNFRPQGAAGVVDDPCNVPTKPE